MNDAVGMDLMSTGELARRLGRSLSDIKKLEIDGRIPKGVRVIGSGRKVWRLADLPEIERALRDSRRKDRMKAV